MDAESEDGKGNKRDVSTKIQVDIGAYRDESNTKTTKEQTNHSQYPQGPTIIVLPLIAFRQLITSS